MRVLSVVAFVAALGLACSDSTGGGGGGRSQTITAAGTSFSPNPDTASAGTLTFSFSDGPHNVLWDTGPTNPGNIDPTSSGTVGRTVVVGTYNFHCSLHGGMNGRVVVE